MEIKGRDVFEGAMVLVMALLLSFAWVMVDHVTELEKKVIRLEAFHERG
jgi:hypothetical protein